MGLLVTIWPIFGLICLGFVLTRVKFPDPAFWPAAEKINYFVLFPALLLSSLVDAPVHDPAVQSLGLAAVLTVLAAVGLLVVFRMLRPMRAARFGAVLQGVVRFNTYLGLAVVAGLGGGAAAVDRAAVFLAVAVPLVNVLSIMALSDRGAGRGLITIVATVLRNPLILACVAGIALALMGVGLPWGTDKFLSLIAQGSLPLGLLCVGAALRPASLRGDLVALVLTGGFRLLAMPVLAAVIGRLAGLGQAELLVLVVFCAVPTAPTSYVLTRQLGGDATLMAGLVTAQTMVAVVTIPLMVAFLGLA